jgi:hypothetical protein
MQNLLRVLVHINEEKQQAPQPTPAVFPLLSFAG